jgi:hypothetical protein
MLTNYIKDTFTLQPILTIWLSHFIPYLTFTLFLLYKHLSSINTTIELVNKLLTYSNCLLEV